MKTYEALMTFRERVDEFISHPSTWEQWEKFRNLYERVHNGISVGSPNLSLQSYIGSDLSIDLIFLARDLDERESFTNEYWIRSQGIQCIRNREDREANAKVWSDILGKLLVTKNKGDIVNFIWIEDADCIIDNPLID